jgi:hypothetical protein
MPASFAEIEIAGGIAGLRCPITGITVIDAETGFETDAQHSPHLRFFVDWIAAAWVADPGDLPADQALYQRELIALFANADEEDDQNTLIAKCVQILPKSALVLEILDPPTGSYQGEICYVCFDLGAPATTAHVRLQGID